MRQHQPQHLAALQNLWSLPPDQAYALIAIDDHTQPNHVPSEVLAILVRSSSSHGSRMREEAAAALTHRAFRYVSGMIHGTERWRFFRGRDDVIEDAVSTVLLNLLADTSPISNSEVRFGVFIKERTVDFLRSLMTQKASQPSYHAFAEQPDEDGRSDSFRDGVEDAAGETPEEVALREQLHARVEAAYLALPRMERLAVYFRLEQGEPWKRVAEFLDCSIPTARTHYDAGFEKLTGEL